MGQLLIPTEQGQHWEEGEGEPKAKLLSSQIILFFPLSLHRLPATTTEQNKAQIPSSASKTFKSDFQM
jgi:hypothetical protein